MSVQLRRLTLLPCRIARGIRIIWFTRLLHPPLRQRFFVWRREQTSELKSGRLYAGRQLPICAKFLTTSHGSGVGTPYASGAYGEPKDGVWTAARFRYTGQIALPEARLYHYKARVYDPMLGRFLQCKLETSIKNRKAEQRRHDRNDRESAP
jgi:RHS repeat-associated protein